MTKATLGAVAIDTEKFNAKPRSTNIKLQRMKDEASYWALFTYTWTLKWIGDAAELASKYKGREHR